MTRPNHNPQTPKLELSGEEAKSATTEMGKSNDGVERLTDEDLLTEVLSRLSVNYLVQCKAVSKSWYSLISSPSFIKSHYQRAITSNSTGDDTLIVRHFKDEHCNEFPEEDGSYSLFQLGGSDDFIAHLKFPFSKGDYPFTPPSLLIGCVYGIVCVCVDPSAHINASHCFPTSDKSIDIYIWNPAIKQSKLIPSHTQYGCDYMTKVALGFGFDPIDFDFKVVRVVSRTMFPELYSANRDAWRNIETKLIDVPYENKFDICLHGFLFATGYNGMMAFNLNKEMFICDIKLPVSSDDSRECYDARIADFKDSISVIFSLYKELDDQIINLWTLDDEACLRGAGVEASWTFMLSIDVGVKFDYLRGFFNSVEFLLVANRWFFYNLDKKVGRYITTNPFFDFDEVFKYRESLLSFAGSKLVEWSDDEDVAEESSVDSEDDDEDYNEESRVDSEDDKEENTAHSEDNENSNIISQDEKEESSVHSEDDNEEKNAGSGGE